MVEQNKSDVDNLRVIVGEFQRQNKKELSDDETVKILKKLKESADESFRMTNRTEDKGFSALVEIYMPKQATDDEIKKWIKSNIDFSKYKNKMQSMKDILKEFSGRTSGDKVKTILEEF